MKRQLKFYTLKSIMQGGKMRCLLINIRTLMIKLKERTPRLSSWKGSIRKIQDF